MNSGTQGPKRREISPANPKKRKGIEVNTAVGKKRSEHILYHPRKGENRRALFLRERARSNLKGERKGRLSA